MLDRMMRYPRRQYGVKENSDMHRLQLEQMRIKKDQTLRQLAHHQVRTKVQQAYPMADPGFTVVCIDMFTTAVDNKLLRQFIAGAFPSTFDAACYAAEVVSVHQAREQIWSGQDKHRAIQAPADNRGGQAELSPGEVVA